MSDQPVTLFSAKIDPDGVLTVLRGLGAKVVTEGSPWRSGAATFGGGWFTSGKVMRLEHQPEYYADESFAQQLPGMTGHALKLGAPEPLLAAIRSFRFAVTLVPGSRDPGDPRWVALLAVAQHLDAVIFTNPAYLDAQGRGLASPGAPPDPAARAPVGPPNPILVPTGALYDREAVKDREPPPFRADAVAAVSAAGFRAPWWLPVHPTRLREPTEIAARALALNAFFAWATAPDSHVGAVIERIDRLGLRAGFTPREAAIFERPAARSSLGPQVGWRLENLWPLCWALGFEPTPSLDGRMIDTPTTRAMLVDFLGGLSASPEALLARARHRTAAEVGALEDRFYLAHHAVRSAQLGKATVPQGFHPALHGGVIHERRHALTWLVSAPDAWDETDLST